MFRPLRVWILEGKFNIEHILLIYMLCKTKPSTFWINEIKKHKPKNLNVANGRWLSCGIFENLFGGRLVIKGCGKVHRCFFHLARSRAVLLFRGGTGRTVGDRWYLGADVTEELENGYSLPVSSIGATLLPCLLRLIINACSRPLPLVKTTIVCARISSSMINSIIGLS